MKIFTTVIVLIFFVSSCDYFSAPKEPKAIARVGKSYLYQDDIIDLVPKGTSKSDSIAIVKSFIDRWATQKLLFEASERNLSNDKIADIFTLNVISNIIYKQKIPSFKRESHTRNF